MGGGGGGGGGRQTHPLYFLKTIEDIDMKLTPLIKRRQESITRSVYLTHDYVMGS